MFKTFSSIVHTVLLIVPVGIEMLLDIIEIFRRHLLLIVPVGIEMCKLNRQFYLSFLLLIVPVGIEIFKRFVVVRLILFF